MTINDFPNKEDLKAKIKFYRKQSGLTQEEVANKMGISRTKYAYAENQAEKITSDFIDKFAKALNISAAIFKTNEFNSGLVLKSSMPDSSKQYSPLILSNKEIRMIKMLRILPKEYFENIYNNVKNDYESDVGTEEE